MNTVIYARFSSHNQTEQSIEGQVRVCRAWAERNGHTVSEIYADRAVSGRTDNRPEFQRLIRDAKAHKFEAIIVYKVDRFGRDKYDIAIYKKALKNAGVQLFYAAENIPEGPEGIILEALMEGLAEYYSAELAQKVRRGLRESALKAKSTGGSIPLGYRLNPDTKSLEIIPEQARIVRMIFEMFANKSKKSEICQVLNDSGYTSSKGYPFSQGSLDSILSNKKYAGVYRYDDIEITGGCPAIISEELFEQVQKERELRKRTIGVKHRKTEYLLSGKLYCGECGSLFSGTRGTSKNGQSYRYYTCPGRKSCKTKNINASKLEDLVADETRMSLLTDKNIKVIAKKCLSIMESSSDREQEKKELQKMITDNKKAVSSLVKALETGIETETIPKRIKELETERKNLESELEYLQRSKLPLKEEHFVYLLKQHKSMSDTGLIQTFVNKVVLYQDKIEIYYNLLDDGHNRLVMSEKKCSESVISASPNGLQTRTHIKMISPGMLIVLTIKKPGSH